MNCEYIQDLRDKLQKRVVNFNSINYPEIFHSQLKQLWEFLRSKSVFLGITDDLVRQYASIEEAADNIMNRKSSPQMYDNECQHAALSYFVIKKCAESDDAIEFRVSMFYQPSNNLKDALNNFISNFLKPLYEYLDEQLSDQNFVLTFLLRYKQKCEWFQRDKLYKLWENANENRQGEKILRYHLLEYLHDQGFSIFEEPSSASGELDLIAAYENGQQVVIETKVFNNEKGMGKQYIVKGFKQAYLYFEDHNAPAGYLIIYKTCQDDLKFTLANEEQSIPFVVYNNKTIFLVTIDIFPHEVSASKRGALKPIEITEDDLVKSVKEDLSNN
jgi:hypothetical protein